MSTLTRRFGTAAVLLSLGAGSLAAASAAPIDVDSAATISSTCIGPGRLSLVTSAPLADGSVRVRLTATGMADGSRWAADVAASRDERQEGGNAEFRRTAVDGGWVARARLAAPPSGNRLNQFVALAFSGRDQVCVVLLQTTRPTIGVSACAANVGAAVLARYRPAGDSLVVRFLADPRPGSHWRVELRASGSGSRQTVSVGTVARPRGLIDVKAALEGIENPRLRIVASRRDGKRCVLRLDPADITTGRFPAAEALRDAVRGLSQDTRARMR